MLRSRSLTRPAAPAQPRAGKPLAGGFTVVRALRWLLLAGVLLLFGAGAALWWALGSVGGRDTLLEQIVGRLPPDALVWRRAEGVVAGPLTLYGVRYSTDGVTFSAERLTLDPALRPLVRGRLQLDALEVRNAVLDLPPDTEEPFELPGWPEILPQVVTPLPVRAARVDVRELAVTQSDATLIAIRTLSGALAAESGQVQVDALALDSDRGRFTLDGGYAPGRNFRTALRASATLPPAAGAAAARLTLRVDGDLDTATLAIDGQAPAPLTLRIALKEGRGTPQWSAVIDAPQLDPATFGIAEAGAPLALTLQAQGRGGTAEMHGRLARGEFVLTLAPSRLAYEEGTLRFAPLALQVLDGEATLSGQLALGETDPSFAFESRVSNLTWRAAEAAPVAASGELNAEGRFSAWTVNADLQLVRDGEQATLAFAGQGTRAALQFERLSATTPGGGFDGSGEARWAPTLGGALEATLRDFDPGYFAPGWDGRLKGALSARGTRRDDGAWDVQAEFPDLRGELRGRTLAARGKIDWQGDRGDGALDARLGGSHVIAAGRVGAQLDAHARLAPLNLADALPAAAGTLTGEVRVSGRRDAPDIRADLRGAALRWGEHTVQTLTLGGQLPGSGDGGALRAQIEAATLAGVALDRADVRARGSLSAAAFEAQLVSPDATLDASGHVRRRGAAWDGTLDTLRLAPRELAVWTLQAPANFSVAAPTLRLETACLGNGDASLCAMADWPRTAVAEGRALPFALLEPWLNRGDVRLAAEGTLDLDGQFAPAPDGAFGGTLRLQSDGGRVQVVPAGERPVFAFDRVEATATLSGARVDAEALVAFPDGGRVQASAQAGLDAAGPLAGTIELDVRDLTWMELLSQDVVEPRGRLHGTLALAGTVAAPRVTGDAGLREFRAELPAYGITLTEGELALTENAAGQTALRGAFTSGEGRLAIEGALGAPGSDEALALTVRGENFLLSDTPQLRAVISPDLELRLDEKVMRVRGRVDVPSARIDIEKLEGGTAATPDVVIADPDTAEAKAPVPLDNTLDLRLGEDVRLKGFGLDGRLAGALRVRQRPNRAALASGNLDVIGTYAAYGQKLTLQRARLSWANSALDNPTLDIRADREFEEQKVGVRVRGTALSPQTTVTSDPALDTTEALSWLVLGRPLSSASGADGQRLGAAAFAMGAGGNLVAQKLGQRLGFDQAGISESRALGGATFSVGKYLSPKLLLSYGVSLLGAGQVVSFQYFLPRGFDVEVESGVQNAATINWRKEK